LYVSQALYGGGKLGLPSFTLCTEAPLYLMLMTAIAAFPCLPNILGFFGVNGNFICNRAAVWGTCFAFVVAFHISHLFIPFLPLY
jgi:hypothetical protein